MLDLESLVTKPHVLNAELWTAINNDPTLYVLRRMFQDNNIDELTALRASIVVLANEKQQYFQQIIRGAQLAPAPIIIMAAPKNQATTV